MKTTKTRPALPSLDAPLAERTAWRERYLKWIVQREQELTAEYGPAHAAECIRQERFIADNLDYVSGRARDQVSRVAGAAAQSARQRLQDYLARMSETVPTVPVPIRCQFRLSFYWGLC